MLTNTQLSDIVVLKTTTGNAVRVHYGQQQFAKEISDDLLSDHDKTAKYLLALWVTLEKFTNDQHLVTHLVEAYGYSNVTVGEFDEDDAVALSLSVEGDCVTAFEFDGDRVEDTREANGLLETEEPTEVTKLQLSVQKILDKWVVTDGNTTSPPYPNRDKARLAKQMYEGDPSQWLKLTSSMEKVAATNETTVEMEVLSDKGKGKTKTATGKVTKFVEPVSVSIENKDPKDKKSAAQKLIDKAPTTEELTKATAKVPKVKGQSKTVVPELSDGDAANVGSMLSKSDKIRYLHGLGWTPAAISKFLKINYAFAYTVVNASKKGVKWVNWKKEKPGYQERRRKIKSVRYRDEVETWLADRPKDARAEIMAFVNWLEAKTEVEVAK